MALQNYNMQKMGGYLSSRYQIPNYQREYSWEENELEDFWLDLESTVNSDDDKLVHFFGQVVIHADSEKGNQYIIDGQQRTITSVIFLKAVRYQLELLYQQNIDNDNRALARSIDRQISLIDSNYLGYDPDKPNGEQKFKLVLSKLDNDFFVDSIMLGGPTDAKKRKKSWERLRFAYKYLNEKLEALISVYSGDLSRAKDQVDIILKYETVFLEQFKVMYMEATDLSEAFTIFETLNARGKDLETADLLKNYLLSKSKDTDRALAKWNEMADHLINYDPTKFVRYFWNSYQPFARDKGLYREITKKVRTPRDADDFLVNLAKLSSPFHDLAFPEEIYYFTDEDIKTSLRNLKTLKASTFYPIILAMLQSPETLVKEEKSIATVLKTLEVFIFRNFTIGGLTANSAEVKLAAIAKEIFDGSLATVDQIVDRIKEQTVKDEQFENDFKLWSGGPTSKETIRYIFRRIHKYFDRSNEINLDNSEVHIEHIMPEEADLWVGISEAEHAEYLWRLGNLCLLSGTFNREISNKVFSDKKQRYCDSKIEPNSTIADETDWTPESIVKRQENLAKTAISIWKL